MGFPVISLGKSLKEAFEMRNAEGLAPSEVPVDESTNRLRPLRELLRSLVVGTGRRR